MYWYSYIYDMQDGNTIQAMHPTTISMMAVREESRRSILLCYLRQEGMYPAIYV